MTRWGHNLRRTRAWLAIALAIGVAAHTLTTRVEPDPPTPEEPAAAMAISPHTAQLASASHDDGEEISATDVSQEN